MRVIIIIGVIRATKSQQKPPLPLVMRSLTTPLTDTELYLDAPSLAE